MNLKSIKNLDVAGKIALVRAGFDVPMRDGRILNDFRIRVAIPTIEYLAKRGAKVVILAHLDRPEGWRESLSLAPAAKHLAEILRRKFVTVSEKEKNLPDYPVSHLFFFRHNIEKIDIRPLLAQMKEGDIAVLENIRFYPGETEGDKKFARMLASLGDCYVDEAFSDAHRKHASIIGVPQFLPSVPGFGFARELDILERFMSHPKKPVVVMVGGIKITSKLEALRNLAKISDYILLGGGLASLFLKMAGYEIGKSVWEENSGDQKIAKELWRDFREKIYLPVDAVVSKSRDGKPSCVKIEKIRPGQMILDIGPETTLLFSKILKKGRALLWNGPLGYVENRDFAHGTLALGRLFASRTKTDVSGIAGGGDTLEVIADLGMEEFIDHLSTGGGAMLNFLAEKKLPALEKLTNEQS